MNDSLRSYYPIIGAVIGIITVVVLRHYERVTLPVWDAFTKSVVPVWPYIGGATAGLMIGLTVALINAGPNRR